MWGGGEKQIGGKSKMKRRRRKARERATGIALGSTGLMRTKGEARNHTKTKPPATRF